MSKAEKEDSKGGRDRVASTSLALRVIADPGREARLEGIELKARRKALGLDQAELAKVLKVAQSTVSNWESGSRKMPPGIDGELVSLEDAVEEIIGDIIDAATKRAVGGAVALVVHDGDEDFWDAYPKYLGIPVVAYQTACAQAAAEMRRVDQIAVSIRQA